MYDKSTYHLIEVRSILAVSGLWVTDSSHTTVTAVSSVSSPKSGLLLLHQILSNDDLSLISYPISYSNPQNDFVISVTSS